MPRISTAIQRISQQIRLSLTLAKSSADLRVFISKSRPASERVLININSNSKTKAFESHKFSSGLPQKARCKRIAPHSQQHRFQFQKRAQKLIRLDSVATPGVSRWQRGKLLDLLSLKEIGSLPPSS